MNTLSDQPNEILKIIFGFVDGLDLIRISQVNHKWAKLIEEIMYKPNNPSIEQCIIQEDYYHFKKYLGTKLNDHQKKLIKLLQNEILIKHFKIDIEVNIDGLLIDYSEVGDIEVVKLLLEKGANLHDSSDLAFCLGAENGHIEVVKLLLERGADIHTWNDDAFIKSAKNGHIDVLKLLLEKANESEKSKLSGADIHTRKYSIPLIYGAKKGHINVVKLLLENGADLHDYDNVALRRSAKNGHTEIVKLLLENGADINVLSD